MTFLTKLKDRLLRCEGVAAIEAVFKVEDISKLIELVEEAVQMAEFYKDSHNGCDQTFAQSFLNSIEELK